MRLVIKDLDYELKQTDDHFHSVTAMHLADRYLWSKPKQHQKLLAAAAKFPCTRYSDLPGTFFKLH